MMSVSVQPFSVVFIHWRFRHCRVSRQSLKCQRLLAHPQPVSLLQAHRPSQAIRESSKSFADEQWLHVPAPHIRSSAS
jgi:hypothetical protein